MKKQKLFSILFVIIMSLILVIAVACPPTVTGDDDDDDDVTLTTAFRVFTESSNLTGDGTDICDPAGTYTADYSNVGCWPDPSGDATFDIVTTGVYEGLEAFYAQTTLTAPAVSASFWAVIEIDTTADLSAFNYLKFAVKTDSSDVWVKFGGNTYPDVYQQVTVAADSAWHEITMNVTAFTNYTAARHAMVKKPFIFGTSWTGNTYFDNIRWE